MADEKKRVEFYGLSTCGWCRRTREWLDEHGVEYELNYVDKLTGEKLEKCKARIKEFFDRQAFPMLIIDNGSKVIQGYHTDDFEEELG